MSLIFFCDKRCSSFNGFENTPWKKICTFKIEKSVGWLGIIKAPRLTKTRSHRSVANANAMLRRNGLQIFPVVSITFVP